ncbi:MAG: NYN domain-containing protein [Pyrinomonadaceae bacterium]|nr:NYN domain-containing protein [Acidobacteriota bacterium]MDQ3490578.1 NYN domain-containing protein [Acidobacteriota bacterium]
MQFDTTTSSSWKFGHRGRVAVFIDGNNLFHAARFHSLDIDYNKLLRILLGDGRLLRAFFYTGVDTGAERQQGFLLWMRRNGFRVVQKELKTFYDGTRKANLDVEIAVDMLSLAGRYDTAVLVSGDEDFVYAINAVAYKGCRVEVAGFRSNTAPRLIDVADFFIDLGDIPELIRKDITQIGDYDVPSFVPPDEMPMPEILRHNDREQISRIPRNVAVESGFGEDDIESSGDFVRVTDEQ